MILPKRLKKGDTIGVIAPSGHLREVNIDDVEKSLINMGYNVNITPIPLEIKLFRKPMQVQTSTTAIKLL